MPHKTDKPYGNPIWCSKETKERIARQAKENRRTEGKELDLMIEDYDRLVALNVPVLGEKRNA